MDIDFKDWKDNSSLAKIKKSCSPRPYLSEIVKLKFERGNYNVFYSYGYNTSPYQELNFLTAKYLKNLTGKNSRVLFRGIARERKETIIKNWSL